jgi:hypothetical protein
MKNTETERKPLTINGLIRMVGELSVAEVVLVICLAAVIGSVSVWKTKKTMQRIAPANGDEVFTVRRFSAVPNIVPKDLAAKVAEARERLTHGDYVDVVLAATMACRDIETPTPSVQEVCGEALARSEYVR